MIEEQTIVFDQYSAPDNLIARLTNVASGLSKRLEQSMRVVELDKVTGDDLRPGVALVINWAEEHGISDWGYVMALQPPMCAQFMEDDIIRTLMTSVVHVPEPTREAKADPDGPKWICLLDLLQNPMVESVRVNSSSAQFAKSQATP